MQVLVADKFEDSGLNGLRQLGTKLHYQPDLKDEALGAKIGELETEILVVRSTRVTAEMLDGSVRLVVRAGAGTNTIDVAAATSKGVQVANCPGKNAQAVAELAFGLILAVDRRIPDNVVKLREGVWDKKGFGKAAGLHGRTLGLVGMGSIGQEMVPRAKAFGMTVLAFSSWLSPDEAKEMGIEKVDDINELAARSDIVSVHSSLRPETRGLISAAFFQAMKPNSIFVNTSRAELVDQAAMLSAIESKPIFAGLDVFDGEPESSQGSYDGPLRANERVYCTHHIGASTDQAQEAVASEVVRIVQEFMASGQAPNVVNPSAMGKEAVAS